MEVPLYMALLTQRSAVFTLPKYDHSLVFFFYYSFIIFLIRPDSLYVFVEN